MIPQRRFNVFLKRCVFNFFGNPSNVCFNCHLSIKQNGPGYPVKVSAVKKDCTKKTLGLLRVENSELEFCDGDEWRIVVTKADNSPENPG